MLGLTTFTHQDGNTALLEAAYKGHLPVVEFLLTKGANLEAENKVNVWRRARQTHLHAYNIARGRVDSGLL